MNQAGGFISTQADFEKFSNSTTERKSMSTKTTIKRISLVAVGALTLGLLSIVPSQAAVSTSTTGLAFSDGTTSAATTINAGDSATVYVKSSFVANAQYDSVTVVGTVTDVPATSSYALLRPVLYDSNTASATPVTFSGTADWAAAAASVAPAYGLSGSDAANKAANATWKFILSAPSIAGTYKVIFVNKKNDAGAAASDLSPLGGTLTWTITVAANSVTALGNSSAYLRAGSALYADGTALTDSAVVVSKTALVTDTTQEATIYVFERNATSTANESLTVTTTGPVAVSDSNAARATTPYITAKYNGATTGSPIYVWATGTAGKATVTVSTASGLLIATKTIYFYGAVTKLANDTADLAPSTIVRKGGKTLSSAWLVAATDAAGMPVTGLTLSCVPADVTVIASCAFTDELDGTYLMDLTSAVGSVSGKSTTITARVVDPAVTTSTAYLSAPAVTVTTGSTVDTVKIATDKASYTAGEQMIVTVTATDSSGNPVYDGAAVPTLNSNKSIQGLTNVATTFLGGKADSISRNADGSVAATYRVFAPAAGGTFTIYADYLDSTGLVTKHAEVSADVTDSASSAAQSAVDAANEATDAANAATDAANAAAEAADAATAAAQDAQAAVAALASQVADLISGIKAQITALTNLVVKIQKKVKA